METLFQTEFTKIEYDANHQILIIHLIGAIKHEDYKFMWNKLLEKTLERNARKLIANQATMERSGMESKAWLVAKWFPKAHKRIGSDCAIAIVASKNLFTKIGGEYIANAVKNMSNFDIRFVPSVEAGVDWLSQVKIS